MHESSKASERCSRVRTRDERERGDVPGHCKGRSGCTGFWKVAAMLYMESQTVQPAGTGAGLGSPFLPLATTHDPSSAPTTRSFSRLDTLDTAGLLGWDRPRSLEPPERRMPAPLLRTLETTRVDANSSSPASRSAQYSQNGHSAYDGGATASNGTMDDVCESPKSIDAQFDYPSATDLRRGGSLKSRKETMGNGAGGHGANAGLGTTAASSSTPSGSPILAQASLVRRQGSSSPASSISGAHAFIGGGFAGSTGSKGRRGSLSVATGPGRRWWSRRGRCVKLAIVLVGAVAAWWIFLGRRQGEVAERRKLDYRWWEVDELPEGPSCSSRLAA